MSVRVQMPPLLRTLTGGARQMTAEGNSVAEVMADLSKQHPLIGRHVFDEDGRIRCSIVFLHDGVLVRAGEAADRIVEDGDEIVMTNALSGG
jgi:sulfur-carrier protein